MQCSKHEHDEQDRHEGLKKKHMSHILMMILCCGLPLLLILLIPTIGGRIPGSVNILRTILPFLCPLMMAAMIPMVIREIKNDKNTKQPNNPAKPEDNSRQPETGGCH